LPDTCEGAIDNVETLRTTYWVGGSGNYKAGVTNPDKDSVNMSNSVNRYYRNGGTTYDAMLLRTDVIHAAKEFEDGKMIFKMKVYTTAPVGTEVNLNFENRDRAKGDYPLGRRCVLQAKTSKERAWDELDFKLILKPDANTPEGSIDQLVLLFAPNTNTTDVFYFDEIGVKEMPCKEVLSGVEEAALLSGNLVYPNPIAAGMDLHFNFEANQFLVSDVLGRTKISCAHANVLNEQFADLAPGTYFLWMGNGVKSYQVKIVKVAN
jgi:hypothetical protein